MPENWPEEPKAAGKGDGKAAGGLRRGFLDNKKAPPKQGSQAREDLAPASGTVPKGQGKAPVPDSWEETAEVNVERGVSQSGGQAVGPKRKVGVKRDAQPAKKRQLKSLADGLNDRNWGSVSSEEDEGGKGGQKIRVVQPPEVEVGNGGARLRGGALEDPAEANEVGGGNEGEMEGDHPKETPAARARRERAERRRRQKEEAEGMRSETAIAPNATTAAKPQPNREALLQVRAACERAVRSVSSNPQRAFREMREVCRKHADVALTWRYQGYVEKVLAHTFPKGSRLWVQHRDAAVVAARRAAELAPDSVDNALFYASTLDQSAGEEENAMVIAACERGLAIAAPRDPSLDRPGEFPTSFASPEERVGECQRNLRELLQRTLEASPPEAADATDDVASGAPHQTLSEQQMVGFEEIMQGCIEWEEQGAGQGTQRDGDRETDGSVASDVGSDAKRASGRSVLEAEGTNGEESGSDDDGMPPLLPGHGSSDEEGDGTRQVGHAGEGGKEKGEKAPPVQNGRESATRGAANAESDSDDEGMPVLLPGHGSSEEDEKSSARGGRKTGGSQQKGETMDPPVNGRTILKEILHPAGESEDDGEEGLPPLVNDDSDSEEEGVPAKTAKQSPRDREREEGMPPLIPADSDESGDETDEEVEVQAAGRGAGDPKEGDEAAIDERRSKGKAAGDASKVAPNPGAKAGSSAVPPPVSKPAKQAMGEPRQEPGRPEMKAEGRAAVEAANMTTSEEEGVHEWPALRAVPGKEWVSWPAKRKFDTKSGTPLDGWWEEGEAPQKAAPSVTAPAVSKLPTPTPPAEESAPKPGVKAPTPEPVKPPPPKKVRKATAAEARASRAVLAGVRCLELEARQALCLPEEPLATETQSKPELQSYATAAAQKRSRAFLEDADALAPPWNGALLPPHKRKMFEQKAAAAADLFYKIALLFGCVFEEDGALASAVPSKALQPPGGGVHRRRNCPPGPRRSRRSSQRCCGCTWRSGAGGGGGRPM